MDNSTAKKRLKRDVDREALTRLEDGARTVADFKDIQKEWNRLDRNRERRERDWEIPRTEELLDWASPERLDDEFPTRKAMKLTHGKKIIPQPLAHMWWRQILGGDFHDVIYGGCPHQMHQLTSNYPIYGIAEELSSNRKDILYHRAILLWSPQRIAAMRDQSDRNIRKVYNKMMDEVRYELFYYLYWRYKKHLPITTTEKAFVIAGVEEYNKSADKEIDWELNLEDRVDTDCDK